MELLEARVERVISTSQSDFAAVVRSKEKAFLIFVGNPEALAIYRELKSVEVQRPLSHDVISSILTAFDIEVKSVVISSIVQNIFCATLHLTQLGPTAPGMPAMRNEVRLDLRASDAMIIALKQKANLMVTREVYDAVEDVSALLDQVDSLDDGSAEQSE